MVKRNNRDSPISESGCQQWIPTKQNKAESIYNLLKNATNLQLYGVPERIFHFKRAL